MHLCEAAEKLADEEDVVSAFHQLQKLHQEFRDTGPVTKELRDEIWNRFKVASTTVNRRHQQHFEALKETEQHNLDQKTVICEIVEAIEYNELKTFLGKQDPRSYCPAEQMENYRFCSPENEREDFRTLPPCLRRFLQEKGRILQEPERRNERESGKEKSALRKSGSFERQHGLENNR